MSDSLSLWNRLPSEVVIPVPGGIQGQAGWDFKQPGLEGGVLAFSRKVGTRWSDLKGPFPPKPFHDSLRSSYIYSESELHRVLEVQVKAFKWKL